MIRSPLAPLLTLIIGTGFQHEFQRLLLGHAADKASIDLDCNNICQDVKSIVSIHTHIFNVPNAKTQGREGVDLGCWQQEVALCFSVLNVSMSLPGSL